MGCVRHAEVCFRAGLAARAVAPVSCRAAEEAFQHHVRGIGAVAVGNAPELLQSLRRACIRRRRIRDCWDVLCVRVRVVCVAALSSFSTRCLLSVGHVAVFRPKVYGRL